MAAVGSDSMLLSEEDALAIWDNLETDLNWLLEREGELWSRDSMTTSTTGEKVWGTDVDFSSSSSSSSNQVPNELVAEDLNQKMPVDGGKTMRSSYPHHHQLGQKDLKLEMERLLEGQMRKAMLQRDREEEEKARKNRNKRRRKSQANKSLKLYQKPEPEGVQQKKRHKQACDAYQNRQLKKRELNGLREKVRLLELEVKAKGRYGLKEQYDQSILF